MTASRYIAVATQLVSKKLQPEQSAALMALASGAPADDSAAALLDEITPPKSLRQTYLELGIVKPTPKELAAMHAGDNPPDHAPDSAPAAKLTLTQAAHRDWFGTPKAGMVEPGSIFGMVLSELKDPARGTLRFLPKEDLLAIAEDFARFAKHARQLSQEK